ncbi:MAG: YfhO family protein [Lachnospiraceae bacterium]|nr:YfhO family protein [Lachnospiraceae bacterium]
MKKKNGKDNRIQKNGIGKKSILMGLMSFLIPFTILTIACKYAGAMPFGPRTLLCGRGSGMTLPAMFQARDQILQGEYLYSFSAGGGQNLYYENPILAMFLWLALVPETALPWLISFVIFVKIGLCGTTMYLYLKKGVYHSPLTEHQNDALILAFSTAYALSSYQLGMAYDFFQVDIICLLPLLVLAMEQLLFHGKPIPYALAMTLELILCREHVISAFLFPVLWLFTYTFESKKEFLKKAFSFVLYTLLAFGMAFWAIYAVLLSNNERLLVEYFMDQNQLPDLYCGFFVLLLLIVCVFLTNKRKKYFYRYAIAAIMLVFAHSGMGDMVKNEARFFIGPPDRYVIFWVFLVVDIAWDVLCEIRVKAEERARQKSGDAERATSSEPERKKHTGIQRISMKAVAGSLLLCLALLELGINTCLIFDEVAGERELIAYHSASRWLGKQDTQMSGLDRVAFVGAENADQGRCDHLASFGIRSRYLTAQQIAMGSFLGMQTKGNVIYNASVPSPMDALLGRIKYVVTEGDTNGDIDTTGTAKDADAAGAVKDADAVGVVADADSSPDSDPSGIRDYPDIYKEIRNEGGVRILENRMMMPEGVFVDNVTMYKLNAASSKQQFVDFLIDSFSGRGLYEEPVTLESFGGDEQSAARWLSEKAKESALQAVVVSDGRLIGEIRTDTDGYICLPIPYEQGWRAVVNNKRAELFRMKSGLIAVKVKKGQNELRLTFIPLGFITGIMVTYLSFLILFLLQVIGEPGKKNKKNTLL